MCVYDFNVILITAMPAELDGLVTEAFENLDTKVKYVMVEWMSSLEVPDVWYFFFFKSNLYGYMYQISNIVLLLFFFFLIFAWLLESLELYKVHALVIDL